MSEYKRDYVCNQSIQLKDRELDEDAEHVYQHTVMETVISVTNPMFKALRISPIDNPPKSDMGCATPTQTKNSAKTEARRAPKRMFRSELSDGQGRCWVTRRNSRNRGQYLYNQDISSAHGACVHHFTIGAQQGLDSRETLGEHAPSIK